MDDEDLTYGRSTSWMTPDQCRHLLAATRVCRLAVVADGKPQMMVMNHVVDGSRVLLRTSADTELAQLTKDRPVPACLEVDSSLGSQHIGWSVIAHGLLSRADEQTARQQPHPWRADATGVLLQLTLDELTGLSVDA